MTTSGIHTLYGNFTTLLDAAASKPPLDNLLNPLTTSSFSKGKSLVLRDSFFYWGGRDENLIRMTLLFTHTLYHQHLDDVVAKCLPPLRAVFEGVNREDVARREASRRLLDFTSHTHPFLRKIKELDSPWLVELFKNYFCPGCFANFTPLANCTAILTLEDALSKRLPYALLRAFLKKEPHALPDWEQFVIELSQKQVSVDILHRGLASLVSFTAGAKNSVAHLEEALENRSTELQEKGVLKDPEVGIVIEADREHLAWREGLKEDSTVRMTTLFLVGKQQFICRTDYCLGAQLGVKEGPGLDRFIHFEVKSALETSLPLNAEDHAEDLDVRAAELFNKPLVPLSHCRKIVLSIAHNCALLGIKHLVMQGLCEGRASPFMHCNMGVPTPRSIDLQGRCAIYTKLTHPDKADLKLFATKLIEKLHQQPYTPYPLAAKYLMQGPVVDKGREVQVYFYIKMTSRKDKNSAAVTAFAETLLT